ncbi:MAG: helix-turn-helix domain-containing protein [Lachnospiraceae bacterium]|nr:helix-turn-helix domain-containing protein [Lachnospiraceae bacterium]
MISNAVVNKCIDEIREISHMEIELYDPTDEKVKGFMESEADSQNVGGKHLFKVMNEEEVLYVLETGGDGADAYMVGRLATAELKHLIIAYRDRVDHDNFYQNLILDNLLLVDIYNRAKKLHIEAVRDRVVFLVEAKKGNDGAVREILKSMFSAQSGDVVTAVDEENIIVIKSLQEKYDAEELMEEAESIVTMLNTEAMVSVRVSYGNVVAELKDVSKSYKEAKMAMDVGKIFYADRDVTSYASLGIGRLIYQLPENLCRVFIDEIFGDNIPDDLDEETLITINKFFENNLNISETSRQLFIHRNTLVYRIEKLQKETGLDLRNFDDAMVFKIALMVVNYINRQTP